jgi:hypothetical protein
MLRTKCSIDDLKRIIICLDTPDWLPTLQKHKSIIESESNISKLTELLFMVINRLCTKYHCQKISQGGQSTNDDYKSHLLNDINTLYEIYANRLQLIIHNHETFVKFISEAKKSIINQYHINPDWILFPLLKRISIIHTSDHLTDLLNRVSTVSRPAIIDIVHSHWEIEYRRTCRMIFLQGSKDPGSSLFKLFHNQYSLGGNNRGIEAAVIKKIFDYANLGPYTNAETGVGEKGYALKTRRQ